MTGEITTVIFVGHQILIMKTVRIQVETWDGCTTIWYEVSRLKEPTELINKRVQSQLAGLNLKRVEVSLSPATV